MAGSLPVAREAAANMSSLPRKTSRAAGPWQRAPSQIKAILPTVNTAGPGTLRSKGQPLIETPDGEQMDIVEVMEIRGGLIRHHRVYWGWSSVNMLKDGQHPR